MEFFGHYFVAENTKNFSVDILKSPLSVYLMFPNYMHCHEWCYRNLWNDSAINQKQQLVRVHALSDWAIHYAGSTSNKYKIGWAYSNMDKAVQPVNKAFVRLAKEGLLKYENFDYKKFPEKKAFDIFHSVIEYSIELHILEKFSSTEIGNIISQYVNLNTLKSELFSDFAAWKVDTDQKHEVLVQSISDLEFDAKQMNPITFAVNTMLRKGKVKICDVSTEIIHELFEDVASNLKSREVNEMLDEIVSKLESPSRMGFDGELLS